MTQQTQQTFVRTNLLQTCYGETGVMDFGLNDITVQRVSKAVAEVQVLTTALSYQRLRPMRDQTRLFR